MTVNTSLRRRSVLRILKVWVSIGLHSQSTISQKNLEAQTVMAILQLQYVSFFCIRRKKKGLKHVVVIYFTGMLACVAWRFWLGGQSNKGGLGQRNLKEIGAASTIVHARSAPRGFLVFLASPLVRLARQNRALA